MVHSYHPLSSFLPAEFSGVIPISILIKGSAQKTVSYISLIIPAILQPVTDRTNATSEFFGTQKYLNHHQFRIKNICTHSVE